MSEQDRDRAEAQRIEAERGRVIAEEDRVDAEAGDGGAELELGRVQAEEARVAAEQEREERENRRRIAEGGADQHVGGNTMLYGRVEAEKDRQANARKVYGRVAALVALPVALVAFIPSGIGLVLLNHEVQDRCRDAATNRSAIRTTILGGLTALGYQYVDGKVIPHGKPIDYYVTHPQERADALKRTQESLDLFQEIDC